MGKFSIAQATDGCQSTHTRAPTTAHVGLQIGNPLFSSVWQFDSKYGYSILYAAVTDLSN